MPPDEPPLEKPPPFLGTWPRLYAALALYLAAVIALLSALTRAYAP